MLATSTVRPETQQGEQLQHTELNGESAMSSGAPGGPGGSNFRCNFRYLKNFFNWRKFLALSCQYCPI
jgi:hypothetical protein